MRRFAFATVLLAALVGCSNDGDVAINEVSTTSKPIADATGSSVVAVSTTETPTAAPARTPLVITCPTLALQPNTANQAVEIKTINVDCAAAWSLIRAEQASTPGEQARIESRQVQGFECSIRYIDINGTATAAYTCTADNRYVSWYN